MEKKYKFLNEIKTIEYLENIFNTDKWRILDEEQSTFPKAKIILNCIFLYMKGCKEKALVGRTEFGRSYHFVIPFSAFPISELFFYDIDLTINCLETTQNIDDLKGKVNMTSEYVTNNARLYKGKLYKPKIIINYVASIHQIFYDAVGPIIHEFSHAYEDYQRLLQNAVPLSVVSNGIAYEKLATYMQIVKDKTVLRVVEMLYNCTKCEQNAYISQMHDELEKISREEKFSTYSLNEILQRLSFYNLFVTYEDDIDFLRNDTTLGQKNEILNIIRTVTQKNILNYNKAIDFLERRMLQVGKDVAIKLRRIIKQYQNGNGALLGHYQMREDFRKSNYTESVLDMSEWFDHMVNYGKKEIDNG